MLGGAYFNQDYKLGPAGPDEIVRSFARDEEWDTAQAACDEIRALLTPPHDEDELQRRWRVDYLSFFNPTRHGMTYRQWFEHVLEVLTPFTTPPPPSAE